jgi:hypothetical protein
MRGLLALAVAVLLGLLAPAPWPLLLPSLGALLAFVTVLAATGWVPFGSLGLPGDWLVLREGGAP